jgi:hypothetical protein
MSEIENATHHHFSSQEEREAEKLRRRHAHLAVSGPAVFGLRDEFHRHGCLWVPGKDKQGDLWAEGAGGNDLVALAPDEETKAKLLELVEASNARYEALQSAPDFNPDQELQEAHRRFAINRNYLRAWAHSAGFADPDGRDAKDGAIRGQEMGLLSTGLLSFLDDRRLHFEANLSGGFDESWQRKKRSRAGEPAGSLYQGKWEKALKNYLYCAWTAETLITLQRTHMPSEQLVRLSNNWSVVQLYYIVHHLVQALEVGVGAGILESHNEIHQHFRMQWRLVGAGGSAPGEALADSPLRGWLASHRRPEGTGTHAFHLGPAVIDLGSRSVSHLAPFDPLDANYVLAECLRNTYREAIRSKPKAEQDAHKGMYTILDYLYKFRRHRNYEENISFVRGPMRAEEAYLVQRDFTYLSAASALLYEMRIMALPHPATDEPLRETVLQWMRGWLDTNAPGLDEIAIPLRDRLEFYQGQESGHTRRKA